MKRTSWAAVSFALLLLVCSTAPVFADEPVEGPDFSQVEQEELERAEWLEGPDAVQQREESRTAYASLSGSEAQDLLLKAFPEQLKALNADPARVLSELEIEEPLGTYGALISGEGGESELVESSVPVESELGGEGKEPVTLSLEQEGEGYAPENPLTDVLLPGSTEQSIELEGGLAVEIPSNNDREAAPLGEMNLFYPQTDTATDTLVSPKAGGVEIFEQLRSPESPEQFRFGVDLPAGATLQMHEDRGAEILSSSEEEIVEVPPPFAVDAQGASVPVTMSVEGESLMVEVLHGSSDVAYPILLDPEFLEEGNVSYDQWWPSSNAEYLLWTTSSLNAQAKGNGYTYGANTYGQWVYTVPGQTTYVAAASFFSNNFDLPKNCATEQPTNQPHGYAGLYNASTNSYIGLGVWSGGSGYTPQYGTGWFGGAGVRQAVVGIGTGSSSVHHKCPFTFSVGGVTIQEKDPEAPTIDWVNGTSSKWVKDLTITAQASDPGLGVKGITLSPEGASTHIDNPTGCTGTYSSRCGASAQAKFEGAYFFEGERSAKISAFDALGPDNGSHVSSTYQWTTKIDRSNPEVELEGQLTEAIEEAEDEGEVSKEKVPQLSLPVYNLKIEAKDGSNAEGKTKRSGMKYIAVFVDGKEMAVPWGAQSCSASSCPMTEVYSLRLNGLQGGPVHHLDVLAVDQVGNLRERGIEFEYIPATGMKDEYVMQYFPLPDGEGNEAEEEHPRRPELAVNVVNGNLVYRQKDVDVEGPAVDLEVERFYNSQLPEEDNTEWGDGWTLAQAPRLEPEETQKEAPPTRASMVHTSGALESAVGLPTESGGTQFDKKLQAVVTKDPGGGYTVEDQSGETDSSLVFDAAGKVIEQQTSGYAKLDYSYEEGALSEIAVDDPASVHLTPQQLEDLRNEPAEWTTQTTVSPEVLTKLKLTDASCASSTACMAVGYDLYTEKGFAEAWDGEEWKVIGGGLGGGANPAVSCPNATTCHALATVSGALGTKLLTQSPTTGSWSYAFKAFAIPSGASSWALRDVSCPATSDCTAVGYAEYPSTGYATLIERWNGSAWSIAKGGAEPSEGNAYKAMSKVSCPTSSYCMAVGEAASRPFASKWNGTQWSLAPVPKPSSGSGTLQDVSCTSSTFCTAVGYDGKWVMPFWPTTESQALAERWDGAKWSELETPLASGEPLASDAQLSAVSCISAESCLAAGSFLTEKGQEGKEEKTLAESWNGSKWTAQSTTTSPALISSLAAVSCTAVNKCTAIGSARPTLLNNNNMVTLGERTKLKPAPEPSANDDPQLEFNVTSGLVKGVEGNETAQTVYAHDGDLLTAVDGEQGETSYDYDSKGRLTKVTLPNGTWGQITYNEADGRVKTVTVDPAGEESAKTTYFAYQDSPSRRTTVSPEGSPPTVYDIAADGSVVKWWNTQVPPEIENLSGSLYANKETADAIEPGDYELLIQAYSAEGIASIEVIANGSSLVDEKTCKQDWGTPERECQTVEDPWVTNTGNWAPGILNLEVIVSDANGNAESTKFWVNVPYTPPPDPEADEPPTFEEVLHFREEFGLDLDLKGDEQAINERIFSLIGDWYNPNTPSGEVARATDQRWGSPLRPIDTAELEYREYYVAAVGSMLEQWGNNYASNTYAGYYVDNRAGGVIRALFTSEPAANLALFVQQINPVAQNRLEAVAAPEAMSVGALVEKEQVISALAEANDLGSLVSEIWIAYPENVVKVGVTNVGEASQLLQQAFGNLSGISLVSQPQPTMSLGRNRVDGQMLAGDRIVIKESDLSCTAGFGAYERRHRKSDDALIDVPFFLTAGHCFAVGIEIWRSPYAGYGGKAEWKLLGEVTRSPYEQGVGVVDAEAIRLRAAGLAPRQIYGRNGHRPKFENPVVGHRGQELCFSGAYTAGVRCGEIVGIRKVKFKNVPRPCGCLKIAAANIPGDSGSPVWDPRTGAAVGILRGYLGQYTLVQPLLNTPNNHGDTYAGALQAAQMYDLHLMTGG